MAVQWRLFPLWGSVVRGSPHDLDILTLVKPSAHRTAAKSFCARWMMQYHGCCNVIWCLSSTSSQWSKWPKFVSLHYWCTLRLLCQGCQKIWTTNLKSTLVSWRAKIQPKLKKLKNCQNWTKSERPNWRSLWWVWVLRFSPNWIKFEIPSETWFLWIFLFNFDGFSQFLQLFITPLAPLGARQ